MARRQSQIAAEQRRQETQDDGRYTEFGVYFFELNFPSEALSSSAGGEIQSYIFPLVINPQYLMIKDEFAATLTPGNGGSLYANENGVLQRHLVIRGNTGFRPRRGRKVNEALSADLSSNIPSFLTRGGTPAGNFFSGQRHMHFLQDRVFRIYGDLKRDPQYAEKTSLTFHNTKDQESWLIIPRHFELTRSASRNNIYNYEISATIVDRASGNGTPQAFPPDENVFSSISDVAANARRNLNEATATINDIQGYIGDIDQRISGTLSVFNEAVSVVEGVRSIVGSAQRAVTRSLILPLSAVRGAIESTERFIEDLVTLPADIADTVIFSFRKIVDSLDSFAVNTSIYDSTASDLLRDVDKYLGTRPRGGVQNASPGSLQELSTVANSPLPGDIGRAVNGPLIGPIETQLSSITSRTVRQGDTLANLAAGALGDSSRWRELAALNNLRFPYISNTGAPGTLAPGDKILLPTSSPATPPEALDRILGVPSTAPRDYILFGTDLKLVQVERDLLDIPVEPSTKTDAQTVSGVANLQQGVAIRVLTVRGTDPVSPALGRQRVEGTSLAAVDQELIRLRVAQGVEADPRIKSISSIKVNTSTSDAVLLDITATVKGVDSPIRVDIRTESLLLRS